MRLRLFKLGRSAGLVALALLVAAGCSSTGKRGPVVTVDSSDGSGRAELERVGGIVVGCFEGGSKFRAAAEQKVASMLEQGNRNLFDVFTAPPNARDCSDVARSAGASAVLAGVLSRPAHVSDSERKQRIRKNKPGSPVWETHYTQKTSISLSVRALDVDSGVSLFEHSADGNASHRYTHGKGSAANQDAMATKAIDDAVKDIRKKLLPSVKKVSVRFRDDCATLGGSAVAACQSAISYLTARPQRLNRACSSFGEIAEQAPDNFAIQYNLGLCAEADGATEIACEFYLAADALSARSDQALNQALARNRCE